MGKKILMKSGIKPNTFIGGVGATINTPALLASTLGILVSRIKVFKVVGLDVQCAIIGGYNIPNSAFASSIVTYFNDQDGLVQNIGTNSFRSCSALSIVNFPKCISISTGTGFFAFRDCLSLVTLSFPECLFVGTKSFYNCVGLKTISLPKVTSTAVNVFQLCSAIEFIELPKCTNLGGSPANNSVFLNIKSGCTINVNIALQTNNTGSPDGDLVYAATSRGATIMYV